MKIGKVIAISLLSNILLASFAFGQSDVSGSATISINVVKALEINQVKGDLNFGDFIQTDVATKIEKTPEHGILFEVSGNPGRNVVVDYSNTSLKVSNNNSTNISNDEIEFTPKVKTTFANPDYINPLPVNNGSAFELASKDENGILYLWVGGEMDIDSEISTGGYSGDFAITVSY